MNFKDKIVTSPPEDSLIESEAAVDYSVAIHIEWFKPSEFIEHLKQNINHYHSWSTFAMSSLDGHIYFTPDLIYKCFMDLAKVKNQSEKWMDTEWYDRGMLLIYLSAEMIEFGAVPKYFVSPGYHSRRFSYTYRGQAGSKFFVPYLASVFGVNLIQLENDKASVFRNIKLIRNF